MIHPHALDTLDKVAFWTAQTGDVERARGLFAEWERAILAVHGARHQAAVRVHERLKYRQGEVAGTRVFVRTDHMRGWSEAARRRWRDGIS